MIVKLLRILGSKFFLTFLVFAIWMLFYDQNDLLSQKRSRKELQRTRDDIAYLNKEIAKMETEYISVISDKDKLEQFAREKYRMKRDNEDVFVIEQK